VMGIFSWSMRLERRKSHGAQVCHSCSRRVRSHPRRYTGPLICFLLISLGGRSKYSGISSLLSNSNSCENGTHSPRYVAWRSSRPLSLAIWALRQVQMLWPLPLIRRSEEREAPEVIPLRTLYHGLRWNTLSAVPQSFLYMRCQD